MAVTTDEFMGSQLTFEDYLKENTAEREENSGASTHQSIANEDETNSAENGSFIDCILDPFNISAAIQKVIKNHGAAGIDGMEVRDLRNYFLDHGKEIEEQIRKRKYKPQPVRRVYIPKEKRGEMRKLGIPVVVDRTIQQAIASVLSEYYDSSFSYNSFGFRPKRNCQMALKRCVRFVNEGYIWVVDMDLEKFFDTVPQSRLIRKLDNELDDSDTVSLIHKFLGAGVMENGLVSPTFEGVPQGGPLSPILSNIYLDELDEELERRGHRFVRYADDCMIFCKSKRAAERVAKSITNFIENVMKLKVNREKTSVKLIEEVKYLGYGFYFNKEGKCRLLVHPLSKAKLKNKIRKLTARNNAISYEDLKLKLERLIKGWINHFIIADMKSFMKQMDQWMRRRIRALCWHRWKRVRTRYKMLRKRGMPHQEAFNYANTRRGTWAVSGFYTINKYINLHVIHDVWKFTSFVRSYDYKLRNYKLKLAKKRGIPPCYAEYIS